MRLVEMDEKFGGTLLHRLVELLEVGANLIGGKSIIREGGQGGEQQEDGEKGSHRFVLNCWSDLVMIEQPG